MRVLLPVSAFNSPSRRAWCALRQTGHDVGAPRQRRPVIIHPGPAGDRTPSALDRAGRTLVMPVAPRRLARPRVADTQVGSAVPLSA